MKGARVFNFRPAAFAAVFLCLGIFAAYALVFYGLAAWLFIFLLPLALLFGGGAFKRRVIAVLLLGVAFAVGFCAFLQKVNAFEHAKDYQGQEVTIVASLQSERATKAGAELVLSDLTVDGKAENGKLVAYLPASFLENFEVGNRVLIKGALYKNEISIYGLGEELYYTLYGDSGAVVERTFSLFVFLRSRLQIAIESGMDETSAAVTIALLTGDENGIARGLLDNIRYGGIAHVFAVSGLHIGALFGFVMLLIEKTPLQNLSKPARFLCVLAVLLFYGGICGFSASVVRAIVICASFYFAKLGGLNKDFLEALGLGALLVLCFRPSALFEAGFQLSFAACLGMALFARPFQNLAYVCCYKVLELFTGKNPLKIPPKQRNQHPPNIRERILRSCVSFFSASTSAQLATAPLCLAHFGYLSVASLFLNFLFVPFVGVLFSGMLICASVAALLQTVFQAAFLGVILRPIAVVWSAALLAFQTIDFSAWCLQGVLMPQTALVCYYLALSFASDKWNLSKYTRFLMATLGFLASFSCVFFVNML